MATASTSTTPTLKEDKLAFECCTTCLAAPLLSYYCDPVLGKLAIGYFFVFCRLFFVIYLPL